MTVDDRGSAVTLNQEVVLSRITSLARDRADHLHTEGDAVRRIKSRLRRIEGGDKERANELYVKARMARRGKDDSFEAHDALEMNATLFAIKEMAHQIVLKCERDLRAEVQKLPIACFAEHVPGLDVLGLGLILAETGDLSNYANPAKVWKRMGLGLVNGERQRRVKDPDKALLHGFSPRRRSIMHVASFGLVNHQGPYRELYLERKAYEEQKTPEAAKSAWDMRARRYIEKRLLRELWKRWRKECAA